MPSLAQSAPSFPVETGYGQTIRFKPPLHNDAFMLIVSDDNSGASVEIVLDAHSTRDLIRLLFEIARAEGK